MTEQNDGIPLALNVEVAGVHRLHGEDIIALQFRAKSEGDIGVGLSSREATVLMLRLIDALRTDDKAPGVERSLHIDRETGSSAAMPLEQVHLHFEGSKTIFEVETDGKLCIPFQLPTIEFKRIAEQLGEVAEKIKITRKDA